mgnify:FL=1
MDIGPEALWRLTHDAGGEQESMLATARLAGIQAAKRTDQLVPLCAALQLDALDVQAELVDDRVRILAAATCEGAAGVDMPAMTAAAVAALTVYDMVRDDAPSVVIGPIRLIERREEDDG